jgi:hypothetical protein
LKAACSRAGVQKGLVRKKADSMDQLNEIGHNVCAVSDYAQGV